MTNPRTAQLRLHCLNDLLKRLTNAVNPIWALPHFQCSSCPGDQGKPLGHPAFVDFIRYPDHEPTAGEEQSKGNTGNIRFLASGKAHERDLYGKGISNPDDLK